ncbi:MAG: DNA alkylation repair protein [Candidatus Coproplasma sp.]
MNYARLLEELNANAQEKYLAFHKSLLKNDKIRLIGVSVPILRKLAKDFKGEEQLLLSFPDEYYEVTFIKLLACAALPYGEFLKVVDGCVALIDNWASCDSFKPKCIAKHRQEFIPYIEKYIASDGEFYQRFALTTLLAFYVGDDYIPLIKKCLSAADTRCYYVHMAAAWLVAEVLVKSYEQGVQILKSGILDAKTSNKAISKARESFRISDENKNYLKTLKR